MSTINSSDIFLVNRNGSSYKVTAEQLVTKLQSGDYTLINRGGSTYKAAGIDGIKNANGTDLMVVNRSGTAYKVLCSDVQAQWLVTTPWNDGVTGLPSSPGGETQTWKWHDGANVATYVTNNYIVATSNGINYSYYSKPHSSVTCITYCSGPNQWVAVGQTQYNSVWTSSSLNGPWYTRTYFVAANEERYYFTTLGWCPQQKRLHATSEYPNRYIFVGDYWSTGSLPTSYRLRRQNSGYDETTLGVLSDLCMDTRAIGYPQNIICSKDSGGAAYLWYNHSPTTSWQPVGGIVYGLPYESVAHNGSGTFIAVASRVQSGVVGAYNTTPSNMNSFTRFYHPARNLAAGSAPVDESRNILFAVSYNPAAGLWVISGRNYTTDEPATYTSSSPTGPWLAETAPFAFVSHSLCVGNGPMHFIGKSGMATAWRNDFS